MTSFARPSPFVERLAQGLYLPLAPRLPEIPPADPPAGLRPFERISIDRRHDPGTLAGTFYPARVGPHRARGAVLLAHPWHARGQGYFHRRGRIPGLLRAGYHVLTFDFGGFGESGPRPRGFFDRDLSDALDALERRAPGVPIHFWGVSAGGYWAHPLLARRPGVAGAFFEDVAVHLLEWSKRHAPWGLPFYLVFQHLLGPAYRHLDLRRHAPRLRVGAAAYVGGSKDRGARPGETRELARLAGAECLVVEGADHLDAIRRDERGVVELALRTFARAEERLTAQVLEGLSEAVA